MALIGKIRERTGLTVGIIGIGVILFLVGKELTSLIPNGSNKSLIVGRVAGKDIGLKVFQDQFEQLQHNFSTQYGRTPSESEATFLRDQAWQQLVENKIGEKLQTKLGLKVSEEELVDMVQGEHIHPDLKMAFTNPETKEFDKKQLLLYLQKLAQMPPGQQAHWHYIEQTLAASRCQTKFEELMKHSIFVTDLEARKKYELAHTKLDLQYFLISYDSISTEQYTITDTMLKAYLKAHKDAYQVEERRDIAYVQFPIKPTDEDYMALQEELQTIKQGFMQAQEDHVFASIHTEESPSLTDKYFAADQLPPALAQQQSKLQKGLVIGPVIEGNWHKLYKIVNIQSEKDKKYEVAIIAKSLSPGDEAHEQAFRKADSFAGAVANKEKFEKQAAQDSITVYTAQVNQNDSQVGILSHARELVRWLYNEATLGKVSPVFELPDGYVVAVMTDHVKPGLVALDKVQDEIKHKVLSEKKAQVINEQLAAKRDMPLTKLAEQYGAQLFTAQEVKFYQTTLPGIGKAVKAIGQAFALKPGERSQPIAEERGIWIAELIERHQEPTPESLIGAQHDQAQIEQFKQSYYIPKSLEILAHTKDFRYKYY